MAHDAGLYDAVSALFNALLGKFTAPEEAARWLRELVEDAVSSELDSYEGANSDIDY